jgi:hypothetical protein
VRTTPRPPDVALLGLFLTVCLAVFACGASTSSSRPASPTPRPSVEARLEIAIEQRVSLGLDGDVDVVRALLGDPQSVARGRVLDLDIPLTVAELKDLEQRPRESRLVHSIVEDYGARHSDVYGGDFVDQRHGGVVVGMFVPPLEPHRLALSLALHPGAKWELREARFSLAYLEAKASELGARAEEMRAAGFDIVGWGASVERNTVVMRLRGAEPDVIADEAETFLGNPVWVVVDVFGDSGWQGARGDLRVQVVGDPPGVGPYACVIDPLGTPAWDPRETAALGPERECLFRGVGATSVVVSLRHEDGGDDLGSVVVDVVPETEVLVHLDLTTVE